MRLTPIRATVASLTPGRVRIRLEPPFRRVATLHQIEEQVANLPGVIQVETNPSSGSVVIHFEPNRLGSNTILTTLRAAGLDLAPAKRPPSAGKSAGHSTASLGVIDLFQRIDRRVLEASNGKVNLKFLFPIALFVIGVRQTVTRGLGLDQVPGYVILWYALDAFWKFHQEEKVVARRSSAGLALAIEPDPDPVNPASDSAPSVGDRG